MNILDKLPKRLISLMLSQGIDLAIAYDFEHGVYLDLNTRMKSYAHLYYENGKYIIRMRYGEEEVVQELSDVLYCIENCKQGSFFMHHGWEVPISEGFGEFSDEPLDYL